MARDRVIDQLKYNLLDALYNSDLLAFGYRSSPSKSSNPVKIDPIFFDNPKIVWDKNSAEFNGKSYISIRIFAQNSLPQDKMAQTGRPSSAKAINSAIKDLIQHNLHFCDQPRKVACDQIRQKIGRQLKNGNGLSDKNLSKYIIANCGTRKIRCD